MLAPLNQKSSMENKFSKTITYIDDIPDGLVLDVKDDTSLLLLLASFGSLSDKKITVNVGRNSSFRGVFADFSSSSFNFSLNVNLNGEGGECEWRLASLSRGDNKKVFEPSVTHVAPRTQALMSNYGITRDSSYLTFAGVSAIPHGSVKTVTRQEAKIIVFDPQSGGRASPILRIADNNVDASHAASVGRLSEEHLFYLESRGVSLEEAKRLITLGYLKPIETYFDDDFIKARIDKAIEGGL